MFPHRFIPAVCMDTHLEPFQKGNMSEGELLLLKSGQWAAAAVFKQFLVDKPGVIQM